MAGSIVDGWTSSLRTLVSATARYGKVFVLTEKYFADKTARALGELLNSENVFLKVLGFRDNVEERLLGLYVDVHPQILLYLYRPLVLSNGKVYDYECIEAPSKYYKLEGLIPLAKASRTPVISIIRGCGNIGCSKAGLNCRCSDDHEPMYSVDLVLRGLDELKLLLKL